MTAYEGTGTNYFIGAILESPFLPTHRTVADTEFLYGDFVSSLGCADSADQMACLRALDINTLQNSDVNVPFANGPGPVPNWTWLPVIDGDLSTDLLENLFADGKFWKVPMIGEYRHTTSRR